MEIILLDQMFFQQSGSPTPQQVVEKSCSQYHQSSSIGCKTRRREKRRQSSLIRSKILDSKLSFSPKAPSSLTSNGLQQDSLASFAESSLDWSLWTGGTFCSATRSSLGTSWCWSKRSWWKGEVTGSCSCLNCFFANTVYLTLSAVISDKAGRYGWVMPSDYNHIRFLNWFCDFSFGISEAWDLQFYNHLWWSLIVFREKVSAGLDCRLDAQQELLDLVLQNLRFWFNQLLVILTDIFFQVVSWWYIYLHRWWLSDQVCWLNL